jgi:putative membrane protein insertion efficiency factor
MRILNAFCIAFLKAYQWILSPVLSSLGVQCRFEPTCSQYALDAVKAYGPFEGTRLATWRVLRCHPLCPGGHDPVPLPKRN